MTYDLYVFDLDAPDLDQVQALLMADEGDADAALTPALAALCQELATAFPMSEDDLDGTPWASWPLEQPLAGGRGCAFNIVWSQVEPGVVAITGAAERHGLVVYDLQSDELVAAGQQPDLPPDNWWEAPSEPVTRKRRWWQRRG